jgi:hypothetical protein
MTILNTSANRHTVRGLMAKSFHEICESAREAIALRGREGLLWTNLLQEIHLPSPVLEDYLFNSLRTYSYRSIDHQDDEILTYKEVKKSCNVKLFAPLAEIYRVLGITSHLEIPPDPGMLILENIAKSRENGLLMTEISKLTDKKSSIYPIVDKLVAIGLVQKRMLIPSRHVSNARGKARVIITHLTKFAPFYNPSKDQMEFEYGEHECEALQQTIIKFLTERGVTSLPVHHLSSHFQMLAKHFTRKISTCITQLKNKCHLVLTTGKYRGKGPFTLVTYTDPATTTAAAAGDDEEDDGATGGGSASGGGGADEDDDPSSLAPSNTIFNMTVYEQVLYRLNMFNGLTSRKIKQLVGLQRKRCYTIVSILIKTLKYRHETVQSGRQRLYLIYGNQPFRHTPSATLPSPLPTVPTNSSSVATLPLTPIAVRHKGPAVQPSTPAEVMTLLFSNEHHDDDNKITVEPLSTLTMTPTPAESSSKQVDLYSLRKNIILTCLEKTGGVIDNYTLIKETERSYKELNLTTQIDRKTVKRLMLKFVEEDGGGGYKYVTNFEHPQILSFWMKPHVVYRNDSADAEQRVLKYVYKLYFWFVSGKKGMFLDQLDRLPEEPTAAAAEGEGDGAGEDGAGGGGGGGGGKKRRKRGSAVGGEDQSDEVSGAVDGEDDHDDVEDYVTPNLCDELEPLVREEYKLANLADYLEEHPTDLLDETETKDMPLSLERINSVLSLCPHALSFPSPTQPQHEASMIEDNDLFFDNLRLIYHQLLQLSQNSVTDTSQTTFSCRFMDTLLRLKIKSFISIFGLCDEYLTNIGQRIRKINLRKKFYPSSFDKVFVKSIQLGFTMTSLVFSHCPIASLFGRLMLSRAVEFHKLYLLCLLSLGVISRPIFHTDQPASSLEEFDREVLPFMLVRIPVKPPGSTKALKKISQFNQYWDERVITRISEYLQLKKQIDPHAPTRSLITVVLQSYEENMLQGRYAMPEFPSILVSTTGSSTVKIKKKRVLKRKKDESQVVETVNPSNDPEFEMTATEGDGMDLVEEEFEEIEEECEEEYEEMSRPNKRARRHEVIEVSVDQVTIPPHPSITDNS